MGEIVKDLSVLTKLTNRQLILLQFACSERANQIWESLARQTNGTKARSEETAREYERLQVLLGGLIEVDDVDSPSPLLPTQQELRQRVQDLAKKHKVLIANFVIDLGDANHVGVRSTPGLPAICLRIAGEEIWLFLDLLIAVFLKKTAVNQQYLMFVLDRCQQAGHVYDLPERQPETNRPQPNEQVSDLDFLLEIQKLLRVGREKRDPTRIEYAEEMIRDWIEELEEIGGRNGS